MPKLSHIESEAERLLGRIPEARRRALQQALVALCDAHWPEMRGAEPATPLAHALWSVAPPRADLLADLVAAGDDRLLALVGRKAAQGFALLVRGEIECGNAEGVRLAHEPMMLFDSPAAGALYAAGVAASLRSGGAALHAHAHAEKPPLWKALASIAAQTGRFDLQAVVSVIGVLASRHAVNDAVDTELEALRNMLAETGVQFLGIDDDHVQVSVHGRAHPPVHVRQLGEMLDEIRQGRRS